MAGEKRRDCDTRGRQSTDAQNMCNVHPFFLRWKGKRLSQVFAYEEMKDILDFFPLANFVLFFSLSGIGQVP